MTGARQGHAARAVAVALACAVIVSGALCSCAPLSINQSATPTTPKPKPGTTGAAVATANRTHEYPAPAPPAEQGIAAPSPQAAVLAFANGYINWNASTVVADLIRLAQASVGQARAAMRFEAAQVASDYELRGGRISNSGTVEAIAPLRGTSDQFVVVTQESTSAAATNAYVGLRPAWHITVATVRRVGSHNWVLSGWQPES
jgi:hypothetical protein